MILRYIGDLKCKISFVREKGLRKVLWFCGEPRQADVFQEGSRLLIPNPKP